MTTPTPTDAAEPILSEDRLLALIDSIGGGRIMLTHTDSEGNRHPTMVAVLFYRAVEAQVRAALASVPVQQPAKLWLWKNFVDGKPEYWAFDNAYPVNLMDDDPQTLGQPCGYAIFKPSRPGRQDVDEAQVLREIASAHANSEARERRFAPPAAAAPPSPAAGWIPCDERMPEVGTDCLVWCTALGEGKHFAKVDRWDEQREAPVSWSSATIPIGPGWDDSDYEDISHWMPLPPPPAKATPSHGGAA